MSSEMISGIDELISYLFEKRGVCFKDEEHHVANDHIIHHDKLKGTAEACALIYDTIINDGKIVIVGDFDADGQRGTSDLLMWLGVYGYACD